MKIDGTAFGSITIGGKTYDHDVVIRLKFAVEHKVAVHPKAIRRSS